ncbi:hypothetical protein [Paraherbaspirillum soli]|uniref:DUF1902 domain-containing protein n=1 Tax=Paraherbaspirillum soli TaxID=631222 RepID=A0ABW0M3V9_9BURK
MENSKPFHEVANGDINVWVDEGGAICIKSREPFGDPVELAEHEALELANLLIRLVEELRN